MSLTSDLIFALYTLHDLLLHFRCSLFTCSQDDIARIKQQGSYKSNITQLAQRLCVSLMATPATKSGNRSLNHYMIRWLMISEFKVKK